VADLGSSKKRIAQLLRMLSSSGGERRNAFAALERIMQSDGITWSDIGNAIEQGSEGEGKYTEEEMLAFVAIVREEERARAPQSNGHIVLPEPSEMAQYCHSRLARLKDDKQRDFVSDMVAITQRGMSLSLGRLGYLVSIYIQLGGRI
jgi:hypothetical protein